MDSFGIDNHNGTFSGTDKTWESLAVQSPYAAMVRRFFLFCPPVAAKNLHLAQLGHVDSNFVGSLFGRPFCLDTGVSQDLAEAMGATSG